MVAEIYGGISAFKAMFDLAKGLKDINDSTVRNSAVIELQAQILSAQGAQSAALEHIRELEKKVAKFEAWNADKQRYELKDVGLGSLAYVAKEGMRGTEPPHQICASCYPHGKKSILQPRDIGHDQMLLCSECKAQIKIGDISYNFA
jgi:hypothetical protein